MRFNRRHTPAGLVAGLLSLAGCASMLQRRSPALLAPGSSALDVGHITADTTTFDVFQRPVGASAERKVGVWTVERTLRPGSSGTTVLQVATFEASSGARIVDSVFTRRDGLLPLAEVSHQPSKLMHLFFAGARVRAEVSPRDGPASDSAQTYAGPMFNSSDLLLVVTSVPLRRGFRVLVPSYTYELGGRNVDTLRVEGVDSVRTVNGERAAWLVVYSEGIVTSRVWVDAATRAVLRYETRARDGGTHRLVPLTRAAPTAG